MELLQVYTALTNTGPDSFQFQSKSGIGLYFVNENTT